MGQTGLGSNACRCPSVQAEETAQFTLAGVPFEAVPSFGQEDTANCVLLRASKDGDLEGIKKGLGDGANIDTRLPLWIRKGFAGPNDAAIDPEAEDLEPPDPTALSLTPLMHAAKEGHYQAVDLLLRLGAQVNLHEADGMQALHFAAMSASVECFRLLLGAGANPVATDNFGRDALFCVPLTQIARSSSKREWVQLFKEAKCWSASDVNTKTWDCHVRKNSHEARPLEETSESSKSTASLSIGAESEEASVSSKTAATFSADESIQEADEVCKIVLALIPHGQR
mmetsp:Transcript_120436/g.234585  ORF Transcript_120436/g.234585 Transcript_120436/m.234585 type:complete len:284 (+) Transcript_120436:54-905(+)